MLYRLANVIRWILYGLGGVIILYASSMHGNGGVLCLGIGLLVMGLGRAVKYVIQGE